jgi:hypothetical protein
MQLAGSLACDQNQYYLRQTSCTGDCRCMDHNTDTDMETHADCLQQTWRLPFWARLQTKYIKVQKVPQLVSQQLVKIRKKC